MTAATIRAGTLRTPIWLGRPVITHDAAGAEVLTWSEWKTWAAFESIKGRELQSATATKGRIDWKVTIRTSNGWIPDERWRIRDAVTGALFNILAAMPATGSGAVECLVETAQGTSDGR